MFDSILGQEETLADLAIETARDRLNHAYLFEGSQGSGRLTLARAFAARTLYAEEGIADKAAAARLPNHPDYLELPRDVPMLGVHRFAPRQRPKTEPMEHPPVLTFLHLKPVTADRRVCVIPDAERMGPEAANTFLKTLEEPPGQSLILLTTNARDRMLRTVVSRCRRVRVAPLAAELIAKLLSDRGLASGEDALAIATVAEGSLGVAMDLASGDTLEHWRWLNEAMAELTPGGALRLAQGMEERARASSSEGRVQRRTAVRLLDLVSLWVRQRLRQGLDPRSAAMAMDALWQAGLQLSANVRLGLVLQAAALETIAALRRSGA